MKIPREYQDKDHSLKSSQYLGFRMWALRRAIRILQVSLLGEEQVQTSRRITQADLQKMRRDIS